MEKQLTATKIPGQFILITTHDSEKWGPYEIQNTVYDSQEKAAIAGNKQAVGNTVFVGITKHDFEGKEFFSPGFNAWD